MPVVEILLYIYSFGLFIWLSLFDLRTRLVPNYLTIGGYPIFILLIVASASSDTQNGGHDLLRASLGALILLVFFMTFWIFRPGSLGMGDVKIAPLFGAILAWSSWNNFGVGLAICFLVNGFVALTLLLSKKANRKTHLPLIPFMLVGLTVVELSIFI